MSDNNGKEQPIPPTQPAETRAQAPAPAGEADTAALLEADLKKLQEERDALFEQVARVQADFRNAQKRIEADMRQAIQFANARLIKSLLPVIDSLERALAGDAAKADAPSLLKGMTILHDELVKVLKAQHVEVIAPQPGTPFDPSLHEALMQQPDDRYAEPTVTQLLHKGYTVHGRTLRPAQVAVSK
jgi:molecular chaperone GrpE